MSARDWAYEYSDDSPSELEPFPSSSAARSPLLLTAADVVEELRLAEEMPESERLHWPSSPLAKKAQFPLELGGGGTGREGSRGWTQPQGGVFSETEYENADSEYNGGVFSETESQLGAASPETRFLRRPRLIYPGGVDLGEDWTARLLDSELDLANDSERRRRPRRRRSELDYLCLDGGHDADIDSVASSRASSRVFFDESARLPFPRRSLHSLRSSTNSLPRLGPAVESPSDGDWDGAARLKQLTSDIQQSFGRYPLASFQP